MVAGITIRADLLIKEARDRARRRRVRIAVFLIAIGGVAGWSLHDWAAGRSGSAAARVTDPCLLVSNGQIATVLGLPVAWQDTPAVGGVGMQACRWTTASLSKPQYPSVRRTLLVFSWPSTRTAFEHNENANAHVIRVTNLGVPAFAFGGAVNELNVWKDGEATSFVVGAADRPLLAAETFARAALEKM